MTRAPIGASHVAADPVFPTPRLNLATPASPASARVHAIRPCAERRGAGSFVHLELDVSGTPLEGAFLPGQSFGVLAEASEPGARARLRLYSVASPSAGEDGAGRILSAALRVSHGAPDSSDWIDALAPGATVRITGPLGRSFLLPSEPSLHHYVLISCGTGIAPFRAMIADLASRAPGSRVALVPVAHAEGEIPYHERFLELAAAPRPITYTPALHAAGDDALDALVGALRPLAPLLEDPATLLYICGVSGVESAAFRALEALGLGAPYAGAPSRPGGPPTPTRRCAVLSY